jgi:glutamate synthase (NADPH) large chain
VVLGKTGKNFAAGMGGGIAYVLDIDRNNVNQQMVYLEPITLEDGRTLNNLVQVGGLWVKEL